MRLSFYSRTQATTLETAYDERSLPGAIASRLHVIEAVHHPARVHVAFRSF
jgi:hypothetical protein